LGKRQSLAPLPTPDFVLRTADGRRVAPESTAAAISDRNDGQQSFSAACNNQAKN
jgi:hypothetical protein